MITPSAHKGVNRLSADAASGAISGERLDSTEDSPLVKLNSDFLLRYLQFAPAALALERSIECEIHARNIWQSPVLDIGCGDGIFAKMLFADRVDTGIDLNPAEVECAKRLGAYLEVLTCSGDRIPKPDGSYRTVFSDSVPRTHPGSAASCSERRTACCHPKVASISRFQATVWRLRVSSRGRYALLASKVGPGDTKNSTTAFGDTIMRMTRSVGALCLHKPVSK